MYNCRCKAGFKGDGFTCKAAEMTACRDDFGTKLQKIKVKDIKNPVSFAGDNVMVMEMQTQELFSKIIHASCRTYSYVCQKLWKFKCPGLDIGCIQDAENSETAQITSSQ